MEQCPGCGEMVRWYHKKGGGKDIFNSSWHRRCAYAWNEGHSTLSIMVNELQGRFNLPSWNDLYDVNQPQPQPMDIYLRKRIKFREKYRIGLDNLIKIDL
jgi:hypothetical protein